MQIHTHKAARLLLVRHAQTLWNHEHRFAGHQEVPLALEAKEQIELLTALLIAENPTAAYSSPLTRCLATIFPTATALNLTVHLELGLRERNLGEWEGRTEEEIKQLYPDFSFPLDAYNGRFEVPGGESLQNMHRRVQAVLQRIAENHEGETVLVATHAGIIWSILTTIITNPPLHPEWPANTRMLELAYSEAEFTLTKEM